MLDFTAAKRLLCAFLCLLCILTSLSFPTVSLAESSGKTNAKVILRKSDDKDSKALQTLPEGEEVTILKTSGSWYKVRYGKYTGYVMKKYVNKTSESSSAAKQISALGSAPGIMRVGDENSDVKKLQKALKILGYYDGSIDGDYGKGTMNAVKSYQKDHDLEADGYAGERTVKSIFGSCNPKSLTTQDSPNASSKKTYKTENPDWFKDNMTRVIPKNARFTIKDVKTGKTFEAVLWSGSNHLDAEPRNAEDTATMKSIYGGSWSWRRRPILVLYNGHVYAASMNGMPHGTATISRNNFDGHFCIHFKNSKTHETNKIDSDHQNAVSQASKAKW